MKNLKYPILTWWLALSALSFADGNILLGCLDLLVGVGSFVALLAIERRRPQ